MNSDAQRDQLPHVCGGGVGGPKPSANLRRRHVETLLEVALKLSEKFSMNLIHLFETRG